MAKSLADILTNKRASRNLPVPERKFLALHTIDVVEPSYKVSEMPQTPAGTKVGTAPNQDKVSPASANEEVDEGYRIGDKVVLTNPKAVPRHEIVGKTKTHYQIKNNNSGGQVQNFTKKRIADRNKAAWAHRKANPDKYKTEGHLEEDYEFEIVTEKLVTNYISGAKNKRAEVHKNMQSDNYTVKKFDHAGAGAKVVKTHDFDDLNAAHATAKKHVSEDVIDEGLRLIKTHSNGNKTAKVYKDHEWGEHRVKHYTDGKHHAKADYHTDDADDAHSTAKHWLNSKNEDVETIDELSKLTLSNYIYKATHEKRAGTGKKNRYKKIEKAAEKLANEAASCSKSGKGKPCAIHGLKMCPIKEGEELDERLALAPSKGKPIAAILARKHEAKALKHTYDTDSKGLHTFYHHARAAKRFDNIAKGLKPFGYKEEVELDENDKLIKEAWDNLSDSAKTLVLHSDDSDKLKYSSAGMVVNALQKKINNDTYDHDKAVKLWAYHADRSAHDYAKERGSEGSWMSYFKPEARKEAAKYFADRAKKTAFYTPSKAVKVSEEVVTEKWHVVSSDNKVIHSSNDQASALATHRKNPGSRIKASHGFGGMRASVALAPLLNKSKDKNGKPKASGPWGNGTIMILKVTNTEISIDTANTVYNGKLIRVVNPTTGNVVVTVQANSTVNVGSFSLLANSAEIVEKANTNLLQGTGILAVPVAYKN